MDRIKTKVAFAAPLLLGVAAFAAASDGGYHIDPALVANGGTTISGGVYRLSGSTGQALTAASAGANYRWYAGFWAPRSDGIFSNGFDK